MEFVIFAYILAVVQRGEDFALPILSMMSNLTNKLTFASISDLLGQKFYIPGYQRGYRWQPGQVIALLDDIWEFHKKTLLVDPKNRGIKYCLQPLVVAYRADTDEWEVIDGQQRLTTVYLLLKSLDVEKEYNKKCYTIRYETPYAANEYILDIDKLDDNIDSYHLSEAKKAIQLWIKILQKSQPLRTGKLLDLLLDPDEYCAHFIWYNVTDEVGFNKSIAIDIFDRLNVGKIGLTNAELIKALFMTSLEGDSQKYRLQIQIGEEWDSIERTLGKPEFWNFICQEPEKYVTRIEYLFDILKKKGPEDEEQFTFNEFYHEITSNREKGFVENKWKEISILFQTFSDWFEDKDFYHLVGYLITTGTPIKTVLEARYDWIDKPEGRVKTLRTKKRFKKELLSLAKGTIYGVNLEDDDFYQQSSPHIIRQVLLLFNVLSIIQTQDQSLNFIRFPFNQYRSKDEKGHNIWDIEHIHSQADKDIKGENRQEWIETMLQYFTGKDNYVDASEALKTKESFKEIYYDESTSDLAYNFCTRLMDFHEKVSDERRIEFELLYDELRNYFHEADDESFEVHSLGNLTLLDKGTNRSYHNSFFPVKRMIVLNKAKSGVFIPLCTQNVFLKVYSKKFGNLTSWTGNDSEDYRKVIINTINDSSYDY